MGILEARAASEWRLRIEESHWRDLEHWVATGVGKWQPNQSTLFESQSQSHILVPWNDLSEERVAGL